MPPRRRRSANPPATDLSETAASLRRAADALEFGDPSGVWSSDLLSRLHRDALALAESVESSHASPVRKRSTPTEIGLDIDRDANAALSLWGGWQEEELLARWRTLDPAMVLRACHVIGLSPPKRWSESQKIDFHRRARRFARNTLL